MNNDELIYRCAREVAQMLYASLVGEEESERFAGSFEDCLRLHVSTTRLKAILEDDRREEVR